MKTDDLVVMLATGAGIAPKHVAARRYTIALGWGMPISFALMLTTIGLLSDIKGALVLPGFWIKFGFVVSLAAVSLLATLRLSRPGADRPLLVGSGSWSALLGGGLGCSGGRSRSR